MRPIIPEHITRMEDLVRPYIDKGKLGWELVSDAPDKIKGMYDEIMDWHREQQKIVDKMMQEG